jgi:hypothetical protein
MLISFPSHFFIHPGMQPGYTRLDKFKPEALRLCYDIQVIEVNECRPSSRP